MYWDWADPHIRMTGLLYPAIQLNHSLIRINRFASSYEAWVACLRRCCIYLPPHLMSSFLSPADPYSLPPLPYPFTMYIPSISPLCMVDITIVVVSMKAVESSHYKRIILYTVIPPPIKEVLLIKNNPRYHNINPLLFIGLFSSIGIFSCAQTIYYKCRWNNN